MSQSDSQCPRCHGPLDPLVSRSHTQDRASICVPCEHDENVHRFSRQPLPAPAHWPVPPHIHLCKSGETWPLHRLMGGGNPYMDLWSKTPYAQQKVEAQPVETNPGS